MDTTENQVSISVKAEADTSQLDAALQKAEALDQKLKEARTLAHDLASMTSRMDVHVTIT